MLCCVGLIGGYVVGQSLGGPWAYIAPAAGFGIGLAADMKFMKGHHHGGTHRDPEVQTHKDMDPIGEMVEGKSKAMQQAEPLGKTPWFPHTRMQKVTSREPRKTQR